MQICMDSPGEPSLRTTIPRTAPVPTVSCPLMAGQKTKAATIARALQRRPALCNPTPAQPSTVGIGHSIDSLWHLGSRAAWRCACGRPSNGPPHEQSGMPQNARETSCLLSWEVELIGTSQSIARQVKVEWTCCRGGSACNPAMERPDSTRFSKRITRNQGPVRRDKTVICWDSHSNTSACQALSASVTGRGARCSRQNVRMVARLYRANRGQWDALNQSSRPHSGPSGLRIRVLCTQRPVHEGSGPGVKSAVGAVIAQGRGRERRCSQL